MDVKMPFNEENRNRIEKYIYEKDSILVSFEALGKLNTEVLMSSTFFLTKIITFFVVNGFS